MSYLPNEENENKKDNYADLDPGFVPCPVPLPMMDVEVKITSPTGHRRVYITIDAVPNKELVNPPLKRERRFESGERYRYAINNLGFINFAKFKEDAEGNLERVTHRFSEIFRYTQTRVAPVMVRFKGSYSFSREYLSIIALDALLDEQGYYMIYDRELPSDTEPHWFPKRFIEDTADLL